MFRSLLSVFVISASLASASIIVSRQAPGVQSTSVVGATTETFDGLPTGPLGTYVSPIGTYSSGAQISGPNLYGGALQTRYIAVGSESGTMQYTLTFSGLRTYFGFYWEAVDFGNSISFFNQNTLVATFGSSDITTGLPSGYFGNPNTGENPFEAYVYANFTSTDLASRFDRVVFSNSNTLTGFETDNHSVYDRLIVPEPASWMLFLSGLFFLGSFPARKLAESFRWERLLRYQKNLPGRSC